MSITLLNSKTYKLHYHFRSPDFVIREFYRRVYDPAPANPLIVERRCKASAKWIIKKGY